jgi:hypothetical protein
MYIPVFKNAQLNNNVLVERALPRKGNLSTEVGNTVEPFTKLGMTKTSYRETTFDERLKVVKSKREGGYFYEGEKIGTTQLNKVTAPYSGFLSKTEQGYILRQEERDYWLLSGVWGEVIDVVEDLSVLIRTQTVDLSLVACTGNNISGELVVFPNPTDYLIGEYLENFSKNVAGKIIYVGDFLNESVLKRAMELGVIGLIAGGTNRSSMLIAKKSGLFLGVFTGFGEARVSPEVFNILKDISSRYVFVRGEDNMMRIPVPNKFNQSEIRSSSVKTGFRQVKKELLVMVLQKPYFGRVGAVDRVAESSIFVKFPEEMESVEVKPSNVLSLS